VSLAFVAPDLRHALAVTPRERSILLGAAKGLTAGAIARSEGLSEKTVKAYLAVARSKLGASNTTEAVAIAIREGLIA